jgi:amino acid adenylation domain-containing protein
MRNAVAETPLGAGIDNSQRCVHESFEFWAAQTSSAVALRFGGTNISFGALNGAANYWARVLRGRGVNPETLVGVYGPRSPDTVVAIFAILKAGGGYVPIDPGYPEEIIEHMLQHARVSLVLTTPESGDRRWPAGTARVCVDATVGADVRVNVSGGATSENVAVVIFTSGSEGVPKAVALPHRTIAVRIAQRVRYGASDIPCQKASLTVVAHVADLLMPILLGQSAIVVPDAIVKSVEFGSALERHRIRTVMLVPSQLRTMLDSAEATARLGGVERLLVSGEALTPRLLTDLTTKLAGVRVFNSYGLSETCGGVMKQSLRDGCRITVGTPLVPNTVYVVDEWLREVPVEVHGEVCVAGPQLARGYLHRPALTAERFVPNPFGGSGQRMYRTGDRGCVTSDGALEILGRLDQEVKVRGFRVNIPDVERALEQHPAVRRAAVVCERTGAEDMRLRACVTATKDCSASQLRHYLQSVLAPHTVPAIYDLYPNGLPLLPNGKIDRQRLVGAPAGDVEGAASSNVAAESNPEAGLVALWADVLEVPCVRREDDFFDLGGDSLLAMRMIARVVHDWHVDVRLSDLFENTTVFAFSRLLEHRLAGRDCA